MAASEEACRARESRLPPLFRLAPLAAALDNGVAALKPFLAAFFWFFVWFLCVLGHA